MYRLLLSTVLFSAALLSPSVGAAVEPALLDGLEYRLVGPWRGGRVTAVTGVPDQPHLFSQLAPAFTVFQTPPPAAPM